MARVLIFWSQPAHLSLAEADAWARAELRKVTGLATVAGAQLTQLRGGCERLGCAHDWMLELRLADGSTPGACIEAGACAEWLGDLRLLGMRPAVMVAGDSVPLPGGDG